jgi:hypothetical protein
MTGQMALSYAGFGDQPARGIESSENEPASARPACATIRER